MKKNIVIINAYGAKNIGDAAILESSLQLLNEHVNEDDKLFIFIEDPDHFNSTANLKAKTTELQSPYGYAIRSQGEPISRTNKLVRFTTIYMFSTYFVLVGSIHPKLLPKDGFYSYINIIKNADVVLSMGGGYLYTKNKLFDYFGLSLTLLPVLLAKKYKKKVLFLPMTCGKFASKLQRKFTYRAIRNTFVMCRDPYSLSEMEKVNSKKKVLSFMYSPDLALYYNWQKKSPAEKSNKYPKYITLTAREWLPPEKQQFYEKSLAKFVDTIWEKHNLKTVFIPMVWNEIEDDDNRVAKRMKTLLKNKNCFFIKEVKTPQDVQILLRNAKLSICTRLHSAILATTTLTPFLTLAYGVKTNSFLEAFGLSKWNINVENVTFEDLYELFKELLQEENYNKFKRKLEINRNSLNHHKEEFHTALSSFV